MTECLRGSLVFKQLKTKLNNQKRHVKKRLLKDKYKEYDVKISVQC